MGKMAGPRREEVSNLLLPLQLQIMGMGQMTVANLMKMEQQLALANKEMEMERNVVVVVIAGTTITTMETQTITTMARTTKISPQKICGPFSINLYPTMHRLSTNMDSSRCQMETFHHLHQSHNVASIYPITAVIILPNIEMWSIIEIPIIIMLEMVLTVLEEMTFTTMDEDEIHCQDRGAEVENGDEEGPLAVEDVEERMEDGIGDDRQGLDRGRGHDHDQGLGVTTAPQIEEVGGIAIDIDRERGEEIETEIEKREEIEAEKDQKIERLEVMIETKTAVATE